MTKKDDNNIQLVKYSDFANDLVLSDILSYLLLQESKKVPFLNNSNMEGISRSLKRLIGDMEKEMDQVQEEREKLRRYAGTAATKLDIDPVKSLTNIIKKSKFNKAIQLTHKHKLSLPDLQRSKSNPNILARSHRYHLKRR